MKEIILHLQWFLSYMIVVELLSLILIQIITQGFTKDSHSVVFRTSYIISYPILYVKLVFIILTNCVYSQWKFDMKKMNTVINMLQRIVKISYQSRNSRHRTDDENPDAGSVFSRRISRGSSVRRREGNIAIIN